MTGRNFRWLVIDNATVLSFFRAGKGRLFRHYHRVKHICTKFHFFFSLSFPSDFPSCQTSLVRRKYRIEWDCLLRFVWCVKHATIPRESISRDKSRRLSNVPMATYEVSRGKQHRNCRRVQELSRKASLDGVVRYDFVE